MISGIGSAMFKFLKLEVGSARFMLIFALVSSFLVEEAASSVFWLTLSTSGAEENDKDRSYATFRRPCLGGGSSLVS